MFAVLQENQLGMATAASLWVTQRTYFSPTIYSQPGLVLTHEEAFIDLLAVLCNMTAFLHNSFCWILDGGKLQMIVIESACMRVLVVIFIKWVSGSSYSIAFQGFASKKHRTQTRTGRWAQTQDVAILNKWDRHCGGHNTQYVYIFS